MNSSSVQLKVRRTAGLFRDQWFDLSRNVRTSGEVLLPDAGISAEELRDSERYQPARAAHTRSALREISGAGLSSFSYVDLGSGRGRTLFTAAEFPFQQIIGVEFSRRLHDDACANILRFRPIKRGCTSLQSVCENAKDYIFPETNLVVYLFNPFGLETMQKVFGNLETSLRLHPRHAFVILLWPPPGTGEQVARVEGMRLRSENMRYKIFETSARVSA